MVIPHSTPEPIVLSLSLVIVRALVGRCPHCGEGKLFARYLKLVEACTACGEKFGHIRADDGPAWLTILIVGHILGPILLAVIPDSTWPDWVSMLVWPAVALVMALLTLPYAKAVFIAIIWRSKCVGSEQ